MNIPFTIDEFLDVFRQYNEAVWPAQLILVALALAAVTSAVRGRQGTTPLLIVALLWLWMGVVYHIAFFRSINPASVVFGVLFVMQAGVFVWVAFRKPSPRFQVPLDLAGALGGLLIVFSLFIYGPLGILAGHRYPASPTFGLPCPTTLFTFGLLMWSVPTLPRRVFIIPILWSLVATSAALQLGMWEDLSLPLAAIASTAVVLTRNRRIEGLRPA